MCDVSLMKACAVMSPILLALPSHISRQEVAAETASPYFELMSVLRIASNKLNMMLSDQVGEDLERAFFEMAIQVLNKMYSDAGEEPPSDRKSNHPRDRAMELAVSYIGEDPNIPEKLQCLRMIGRPNIYGQEWPLSERLKKIVTDQMQNDVSEFDS